HSREGMARRKQPRHLLDRYDGTMEGRTPRRIRKDSKTPRPRLRHGRTFGGTKGGRKTTNTPRIRGFRRHFRCGEIQGTTTTQETRLRDQLPRRRRTPETCKSIPYVPRSTEEPQSLHRSRT